MDEEARRWTEPDGRRVSAEPQDQMETISLQGQERVAGACTDRQEITQPPDFTGGEPGVGRGWPGGGVQRAVDLSSLERHAHTSCVLIIPRYALKKIFLPPAALLPTSNHRFENRFAPYESSRERNSSDRSD